MGFAVWIDEPHKLAWAQGTHEYRPMGTAAIAVSDQFRRKDFRQTRAIPLELRAAFAGFYGSLEEVNQALHSASRVHKKWKLGQTPAHLL